MKKQIKITAETAELLHGKSYTWFAPSVYWKDVNGDYELASYYDPVHDHIVCKYKAPTQTVLQKWLREIYSIYLYVEYSYIDSSTWEFTYEIIHFPEELRNKKRNNWERVSSFQSAGGSYVGGFKTYEEALEKGLQESLKLVA